MGYHASYKGFRCLDPTTSKIYLTLHAQFDEQHFPFKHGSQAQPTPSLQISNFLEPSVLSPHIQTPHSRHNTQSGFNPCIICADPLIESFQEPHSSPSLSNDQAPSETIAESGLDHPPVVAPVASHPMITRVKAGMFKPLSPSKYRTCEFFGTFLCLSFSHLDSNLLLRVLLG